MVRRVVFFSLAIVFVLTSLVTLASAAQNVGHTNQKGSLLIWPKVMVRDFGRGGYLDTYISIANDYYKEVWVKCYWVYADQSISDFMFRLTPNQPIWFSAALGTDDDVMTVPPFGDGGNATGELKCWAVNEKGDQQISFNHLYGDAWIEGITYEFGSYGEVVYNAYAFAAKQPFGATVGTGGQILLNGTNQYDGCPQYLVSNFWPPDNLGSGWGLDLALAPCKQDLRQDRAPTCTKAKFDIWNTNETKFTGAYQCIKCWYEGFLEEIGTVPNAFGKIDGYGGEKFTLSVLKSEIARFRVQGVTSSVCKDKFLQPDPLDPRKTVDLCPEGAKPSPFIGVLLYTRAYESSNVLIPFAGQTLFGAGLDGSGFVYWDPAGGVPEAPQN